MGITATDSESGKSAYKDERISVSPCVELGQFEANAEQWIENQIGSGGWYLELQTRIAAQLGAPEPAPSDRTKPDFASMNIGDGYQDFPEEEKDEDEEKPAEDAKEEEAPPAEEAPKEEAKPAAKKKAAKKKAAPKEEVKEKVEEGA